MNKIRRMTTTWIKMVIVAQKRQYCKTTIEKNIVNNSYNCNGNRFGKYKIIQ